MCTFPSQLGTIFTVHVGGQHLTFLFDVKHFDVFFKDKEHVSFSEATLPFLYKGFGVSPEHYFSNHHHALQVYVLFEFASYFASFHMRCCISNLF